MNQKNHDIHTTHIAKIIGSLLVWMSVALLVFGIGYAAVWGIHHIFRCIENILYAVLFFAAVALGG